MVRIRKVGSSISKWTHVKFLESGLLGRLKRYLQVFFTFFLLQFWTYSVSCISWRSVAQANIPASVLIDSVYGAAQFWIIRKIAKTNDDDNVVAFLGYTVGGALGTVVGIKMSILLLGE